MTALFFGRKTRVFSLVGEQVGDDAEKEGNGEREIRYGFTAQLPQSPTPLVSPPIPQGFRGSSLTRTLNFGGVTVKGIL